MSTTADPAGARAHARAMAGTRVEAMPTIPATAATGLPEGVSPETVVWDETLAAGGYAARVIRRGTRLRLSDVHGDACAAMMVFNAERPVERLNVADTVKVQWNAYLGEGRLLLSDMSSDLLKGKMDKVLSGDGESALEVAWLHHTVPVTHPTLRQHILAAQGYAVSCCAGRGSGHATRRCMLAGQHRSAPATCAAFAPRTRCKRGGKG